MSISRAVATRRAAARRRHLANQSERALNRAISNAATPGMRDELLMVAQRTGYFGFRL